MKLEQAIKQDEFSRGQRLALNLIYTFNWVKSQQKEYFSQYDITSQQFNVLRILRGRYPGSYSTSDIRDRMLDKMSDASRIVDRLVKKGLLERTTSKNDRRLVDIKISDKGLKLLERLDETIDAHIMKPFKNLSVQEKKTLDALLDKMRE